MNFSNQILRYTRPTDHKQCKSSVNIKVLHTSCKLSKHPHPGLNCLFSVSPLVEHKSLGSLHTSNLYSVQHVTNLRVDDA